MKRNKKIGKAKNPSMKAKGTNSLLKTKAYGLTNFQKGCKYVYSCTTAKAHPGEFVVVNTFLSIQ